MLSLLSSLFSSRRRGTRRSSRGRSGSKTLQDTASLSQRPSNVDSVTQRPSKDSLRTAQGEEDEDDVSHSGRSTAVQAKVSAQSLGGGSPDKLVQGVQQQQLAGANARERTPSFDIRKTESRAALHLTRLLDHNKRWAKSMLETDPNFFNRLTEQQAPEFLWIGCSDSRVPANQITGMAPGEVFVHRNVANLVDPNDPNLLSVIQYAVNNLRVKHVIVCGHYSCGGVRAAITKPDPPLAEPLNTWLEPLRCLCQERREVLETMNEDFEAKWRWVCEQSVRKNVEVLESLPIVQEAWARGQKLALHGWIYSIQDGLLQDLCCTSELGFDD